MRLVYKRYLNEQELLKYKGKHRTIKGFTGAKEVPKDEIMYKPCDILILAAMEKTVTSDNAPKLQTKVR